MSLIKGLGHSQVTMGALSLSRSPMNSASPMATMEVNKTGFPSREGSLKKVNPSAKQSMRKIALDVPPELVDSRPSSANNKVIEEVSELEVSEE